MTHENPNPQDLKPIDARHSLVARRRLIQGSFAAPVALTLCSGSAFAGSLTGVQIQLQNPQTVANSTNPPGGVGAGTWLRVQVYQNSSSQKFVKGNEINNLLLSRTSSASDFNSALCYPLVSPFTGVTSTSAGALTPLAQAQYAAVRVDIVSNVVRIVGIAGGLNGTSGTALGQSAWTSFA